MHLIINNKRWRIRIEYECPANHATGEIASRKCQSCIFHGVKIDTHPYFTLLASPYHVCMTSPRNVLRIIGDSRTWKKGQDPVDEIGLQNLLCTAPMSHVINQTCKPQMSGDAALWMYFVHSMGKLYLNPFTECMAWTL